jgi:DNA modification methylase
LEIQNISIESIKPYANNPRKNNKAVPAVAASIKEFGFRQPIVVDKDGVIIAGHTRYKAAISLGMTTVPVLYADDLSDAQAKAYRLADNKTNEIAEWDMEVLAEELESLLDCEFKMEDFGFVIKPDIEEDNFNISAAIVEPPVSKRGDVFQLGQHRLMCGDSTSFEDISTLMAGDVAAMVFTDPPYNVNYGETMKDSMRHKAGTNPGRKILNDHFEDHEQFYDFLHGFLIAIKPFVQGDVYVCMSSSELHTLQRAFAACDGHWSTFIIWVKNTFTLGRSNYQRQYEPILYGWFEKTSHHWSGARNLSDVIKQDSAHVDDLGNVYIKADGLSSDIWEFPKPSKNKEHPTMKPIGLCARGVLNSSNPGDVVLDVFGSSGSTLIACEQTNRSCRMMEMDEKYCDVIINRWEQFTGKKAVQINGGQEGIPIPADKRE